MREESDSYEMLWRLPPLVTRLTHDEKVVIVWIMFGEASERQIAAMLGVPRTRVCTIKRTAIAKMRRWSESDEVAA
jgi:DNA-directed RNA polymerase specialized sigma subunit